MRLLGKKGSDAICALGGLILTCWAAWSDLGRSGGGAVTESRHGDVIKA